ARRPVILRRRSEAEASKDERPRCESRAVALRDGRMRGLLRVTVIAYAVLRLLMNALRHRLKRRGFRCRKLLESDGDMLVIGRTGDRMPVLAVGQHVDARPATQALAVLGRIGLAVAMGQRELTLAHAVVGFGPRDDVSCGRLHH